MSLKISQSRLTAVTTHTKVKLDLISKGWIPTDAAEEQPFDIVVDMGLDDKTEKRIFETLQVKAWKSLKTSSRTGYVEKVSKDGKQRNSYWYFDQYIDWIVSVNPKTDSVVYWNRNTYKKKTAAQLKKTTPNNFPENQGVYRYASPVEIVEYNIFNIMTEVNEAREYNSETVSN